jgi:signal peptidase II
VSRRWLFFLCVVVGVVLLDHWTKYLAVSHLTERFDGREGLGAELGALYGRPPEAGPHGYHFTPRGRSEVIDGLLRFRYAENPGAAWGLLRGLPPSLRMPLFHLVSIAAIVLITWYFRKLRGTREERWATLGLPLVLGGAIGNYIDRFTRAFVIDFIEAHWFDKAYWPSFNVADMAIVVGVGCLVVDAFVRKEEKPGKAKA